MKAGLAVCVLLVAALGFAADAQAQPVLFPQKTGEALFRSLCQGCHMPDARGATGAGTYPALARNPRLESAGYVAGIVTHGQKAMPRFGLYLDDTQIANVVNYVRGNFGNRYGERVTPADVRAQR
jgi:mono/diheme cytochrome c family protein